MGIGKEIRLEAAAEENYGERQYGDEDVGPPCMAGFNEAAVFFMKPCGGSQKVNCPEVKKVMRQRDFRQNKSLGQDDQGYETRDFQ